MKNNLKVGLNLALVILLGVGCKKNSTESQKSNSTEELTNFKITSTTFKNGIVDHDLLSRKEIHRPHLSWKNPPVGTKGFWIMMDDNENHIYWEGHALKDATSIQEEFSNSFSPSGFTLPEQTHGNIATVEIFALNCTVTQFMEAVRKEMTNKGIYSISRATLKEMLHTRRLYKMVLGSAMATYKIKPLSQEKPEPPTSEDFVPKEGLNPTLYGSEPEP